ncbi:MAG: hypothetical protein KIT56_11295 [Gammaproteobacteria bacterium]|nr:hypothetical protein [Gammaproteobacteria bacterium]
MIANKIFLFCFVTMLITLMTISIGSVNTYSNISISLVDDLWLGIALFLEYLLLAWFFAPKSSHLLTSKSEHST